MSRKPKIKAGTPLYEEAMNLYEQMENLKATVVWQSEQVEKYSKKYPEAVLDAMSYEEQEKALAVAEELWARMNESVELLKKLDSQYEALRKKVKAKYGKEIMPPVDGFIHPVLDDKTVDLTGDEGEGSK